MNVISTKIYSPFTFAGPRETDVWCDLKVHALGDGRHVCIVTDRPDNPGARLEDAAGLAATWAAHLLRLAVESVVWIEHVIARDHPVGDLFKKHSYRLVEFDLEAVQPAGSVGGRGTGPIWLFVAPTRRAMFDEDWNDLGIRPEDAQ